MLQEAQQARLLAEKADRIKTRLLANVSHELRTPLNIILGYSHDVLKTPKPYGITPPQALLDDHERIYKSAEHQLRVVNDLLDLSRAEIDELDLYLELLDPRPLLQDAFRSMADSTPTSIPNLAVATAGTPAADPGGPGAVTPGSAQSAEQRSQVYRSRGGGPRCSG